jgi:hypothetical protein
MRKVVAYLFVTVDGVVGEPSVAGHERGGRGYDRRAGAVH